MGSSTLSEVADVQATLLQCVTRSAAAVRLKWAITAKPSDPMAIDV